MSEGSFKRRLALLEEGPESERAIYTRQFSDFTLMSQGGSRYNEV
ncbi:hypothetical protein QUB61_22845 [Microcoleus sp. C2D2]